MALLIYDENNNYSGYVTSEFLFKFFAASAATTPFYVANLENSRHLGPEFIQKLQEITDKLNENNKPTFEFEYQQAGNPSDEKSVILNFKTNHVNLEQYVLTYSTEEFQNKFATEFYKKTHHRPTVGDIALPFDTLDLDFEHLYQLAQALENANNQISVCDYLRIKDAKHEYFVANPSGGQD